MRARSSRMFVAWLACVLVGCSMLRAQEKVVEKYPDGTVQRVYSVDADGRKHGSFRSFHENGKRKITAQYRKGLLEGRYQKLSADMSWSLDATYKAGKLHGKLKIKRDRKILSKQKWIAGKLVDLDGIQPFTRSAGVLRGKIEEILKPVAISKTRKKTRRKKKHKRKKKSGSAAAAKPDLKASVRAAALRRLQAYRYLCGLRFDDMELVSEWNDLCDAASEVCLANGQLSHTPRRPPGFDADRYAQGRRGAINSCIVGGGGMVRSVDSYMDDSDPRNIKELGHRRWLLNPAMKLVGFGEAGGYSALWSMDSSGSTPRGMDAVFYPPRGMVPVDFFGSRHAWSISILRGSSPKKQRLKVTVHELDDNYLPKGKALTLDLLTLASGGFGAGSCVVFRPVGLEAKPGKRYMVRVSFDGGKTERFRYVVEFCLPIAKD